MKSSDENDPTKKDIFVPQSLLEQGKGITPLGVISVGVLVTFLLIGGAALLLTKTVSIATTPTESQIRHISGLSILRGNTLYGFTGAHSLQFSANGYETQPVLLTITDDIPPVYEVELAELPGQVTFSLSGPDRGSLFLNKSLIGEVGPESIDIERGTFDYRIEHPKYLPAEGEISVQGFGAAQTVAVAMEPNWRTVSLNSTPSNASVYSEGQLLGQTPITVELGPDIYVLSYQKEGYAEARQLLEIELGEPFSADLITLDPLGGQLNINSEPSNARVFIDDVYAGVSPLAYSAAANQNYSVRLEKEGFDPWTGEGSVRTNGTSNILGTLKQQFGTLTINSSPKAEVYINGDTRGFTPLALELPVATHDVELRLLGYRGVKRQISIQKSQQFQWETNLLTEKDARYAEAQPVYRTASGLNMVLAKPTAVKMGAPRGERGQMANEIEKNITMQRWFYIAETEVSHSHFNSFSRAMVNAIPALRSISAASPNHPVTKIDWQTAALYCNWLSLQEGLSEAYIVENGELTLDPTSIGYRLPTEAEWEWSARVAGRPDLAQNKYPWGNGATVPTGAGNYADSSTSGSLPYQIPSYTDGFAGVAPVGSFSPNSMGLYDMGGNVSEWVHDYYGIELVFPGQTIVDPTGPERGVDHVIKGSSWRSGNETELRFSFRTFGDGPADHIGFRIARWVH